jgi:Domain of unknown function (DUF4874)/Domain of unknown function (DUF4832)
LHQPVGSNSTVVNREPLTEPGVMAYFKRERERTGATSVRVVYSLAEWRGRTIPQDFLDRINADFAAARQNGFKLIPYFSYAWVQDLDNGAAVDATADWTVRHLDQLAPVLQRNADVLALMVAGFIGAWGEWHSSSNGNVGPDGEINEKSRRIAAALFAAVPRNRSVALRYAKGKRTLFGIQPLTADQAFDGSDRARTGLHDESFLQDKWGSEINFDWYDAYIRAEGTYTPSVELFDPNTLRDGTSFTCQQVVEELERRRSDLMIDTADQPRIESGCEKRIHMNIGYRYRLVQAAVPTAARPGESVKVSLQIANDGWSPAFNERPVKLVLRGRSTGATRSLLLPFDPRYWSAGKISSLTTDLALPADLPSDTYDLLLHLPDAAGSIADRADYAIRLANPGVWEPTTGYNALDMTLRIT